MNPLAPRALRSLLRDPRSGFVLAVTGFLEWAFAAWFAPSAAIYLVALALGAGLLVLWPVLAARAAQENARTAPADDIAPLAAELRELGARHADARRGVEQLSILCDQRRTLAIVLGRRLDAGELTFDRYLATADKVYLAALDNLHELALGLRSVSSRDADYLDQRLREMHAAGTHPDSAGAWHERKRLHAGQFEKAADLLAQNEAAITALTRVATAFANTHTGKDRSELDTRTAIAELERLASQTGRYAADGARPPGKR